MTLAEPESLRLIVLQTEAFGGGLWAEPDDLSFDLFTWKLESHQSKTSAVQFCWRGSIIVYSMIVENLYHYLLCMQWIFRA